LKPFFETILIVVGFTGLIILYYLSINWKRKHTQKVRQRQLVFDRKHKQQNLYRIFLQALLNKIKTEELFWVEVYAKGFEDDRIFIKRSFNNPNLLIKFKRREIDTIIQSRIEKFCVKNLQLTTEDFIIECLNDQIVFDLLCFIFYEILNVGRDPKLKFKY